MKFRISRTPETGGSPETPSSGGGLTTDLAERGRQAAAFLKSQPVYWREAALCAPAMPLLLLGGLASGNLRAGVIAAVAAFLVGFGAARNLLGRRWAAMMLAAAGVTLAAFFGSLAGEWTPALLAASALISAGCGALGLIDEDLWWVSLQGVIVFFVAGYYHGPLPAALARTEATAVGAVVQILIVIGLAKLAPAAANPLPAAPLMPKPAPHLLLSHMLRAAVCVVASWALAKRLGLAYGYWAPMTAMLVLKPGLSETETRGLARLTGTVAGCLAAALFAFAVGASPPWLLAGVGLTASAAFALQKAHYALLTLAITATVVLLLSLAHMGDVTTNVEHRLFATVLGGAMALVVARIAPHLPRSSHPTMDQIGERARRA